MREVLDHGDAGGEEDVVRGAVVPRHFAAGLEDHGADRMVGRVVITDGLDLTLHQPLAGAPACEWRLAPEALAVHGALEWPVRSQ